MRLAERIKKLNARGLSPFFLYHVFRNDHILGV